MCSVVGQQNFISFSCFYFQLCFRSPSSAFIASGTFNAVCWAHVRQTPMYVSHFLSESSMHLISRELSEEELYFLYISSLFRFRFELHEPRCLSNADCNQEADSFVFSENL